MKWRTTLAALTVLASGCGGPVLVAPIDSYVCIPSEDSGCPDTYVPEEWSANLAPQLNKLTGVSEISVPVIQYFVASSNIQDIPDSGSSYCPRVPAFVELKPSTTLALPAALDGGAFPSGLKSLPPRSGEACVVFFSPLAVSQLVEDFRRLDYAVRSCTRIEAAIQRQKEIFELQNEMSFPSVTSEETRAKAAAFDFGRAKITKAERDQFLENRRAVINTSEAVRQRAQAQYMEQELVERLKDAVFQVENAAEAVSRQVWILHSLTSQDCPTGMSATAMVVNHSWVTKGTEVLQLR